MYMLYSMRLKCPRCNEELTIAICAQHGLGCSSTPKTGDLCTCLHCRGYIRFVRTGNDFTFEIPTTKDLSEIPVEVISQHDAAVATATTTPTRRKPFNVNVN